MSAELFDRLKQELKNLDETSNLSMTAVFMLPKSLTKLLSWIIRKKRVDIKEVAEYFEKPVDTVSPIMDELVKKNFVEIEEVEGERFFIVNLGGPKSKPASSTRKSSSLGFDE